MASTKRSTAIWSLKVSRKMKLVLLRMSCAADQGLPAPDHATLAADCRVSEDTVKELLKEAKEKGHLDLLA